jgi:hypothetical protein
MSVNRTVASTRVGSRYARRPVRNSSDLVDQFIDVAYKAQVVAPRELDEPRSGDRLGQSPSGRDGDERVVGAVEDERRRLDVPELSPEVALSEHVEDPSRAARSRRRTLEAPPPLGEGLIADHARRPHRIRRPSPQCCSITPRIS